MLKKLVVIGDADSVQELYDLVASEDCYEGFYLQDDDTGDLEKVAELLRMQAEMNTLMATLRQGGSSEEEIRALLPQPPTNGRTPQVPGTAPAQTKTYRGAVVQRTDKYLRFRCDSTEQIYQVSIKKGVRVGKRIRVVGITGCKMGAAIHLKTPGRRGAEWYRD